MVEYVDRIRCPACGRRGFAHRVREVKGGAVTTLFHCDSCRHAWHPKPETIRAVEQRAERRRRDGSR
jgi:uncharacterized Zn finger protein